MHQQINAHNRQYHKQGLGSMKEVVLSWLLEQDYGITPEEITAIIASGSATKILIF